MTTNDMVGELFKLTKRCSEVDPDNALLVEWNARIRESDVEHLIALVARLSTRDKETSRELKALREAVISEVEYKNAISITETMKLLQVSANRLTRWSVFVTVVGIFVGFAGIGVTVATLMP